MHPARGNGSDPDEADWDDDSFPELTPLDPDVERARQMVRESESPPRMILEIPEQPKARFQFGLFHLFVANTVLAIMLAMLQVLAPDMTAFALGLAAFAALIWDTVYQPEDARVRMAIHGLLGIYVLVSLVAFVRLAA